MTRLPWGIQVALRLSEMSRGLLQKVSFLLWNVVVRKVMGAGPSHNRRWVDVSTNARNEQGGCECWWRDRQACVIVYIRKTCYIKSINLTLLLSKGHLTMTQPHFISKDYVLFLLLLFYVRLFKVASNVCAASLVSSSAGTQNSQVDKNLWLGW